MRHDPQFSAWGGDASAMIRDAVVAARAMFGSAISRLGLSADDIGQEGVAKMLRRCARQGLEPSRPLLWWSTRKAGLDLIRKADGPRALAAGVQVVSLSIEGDESRAGDPTDDQELGLPEALAHESLHWQLVAARLPAPDAGWDGGTRDQRVVFRRLCGLMARAVAHRAVADRAFRHAYAEDRGHAIWTVLRAVEPDRFSRYSPIAFPPHSETADRRRAFRVTRRVAELLDQLHGEVHDSARLDDKDGAA